MRKTPPLMYLMINDQNHPQNWITGNGWFINEIDRKKNNYYTKMIGNKTPLTLQNDLLAFTTFCYDFSLFVIHSIMDASFGVVILFVASTPAIKLVSFLSKQKYAFIDLCWSVADNIRKEVFRKVVQYESK